MTTDTLVVMEYTASARFRQIEHHTAVAREDGSLVAVTGPAGDADSEAYAHLFATAPRTHNLLCRLVAAYTQTDEEARGVSTMEYLIEEARSLLHPAQEVRP